MKKGAIVIISVLLTVLQVSLTSYFKIGWLNYNFALVCVIMTAWIFDDAYLAYSNAVITGIMLDVFSSHFLGYNTSVFVILVTVLLFLSKQMYKRSFTACILLSFLITVLTEFLTYLIFFMPYGLSDNAFALSKIIFPQGLVNCIPGAVVYLIFTALDNKFKIRKRW